MVQTDRLVEVMVVIDSEVAHVTVGDLDYGIWGSQIDRYFKIYGIEGKDKLTQFIQERLLPAIERNWRRFSSQ